MIDREQLVGFVGLGTMGSAIAANIVRGGFPVRVFDLRPERIAPLVDLGARRAASVAELAAECDVVCTSLPHPPVFVQVAESEIIPHMGDGTLIVDFGTCMPSQTRRLATLAASHGGSLVDAPVSGGAGGAKSGLLRVFCGGVRRDVERLRPLLELIGDPKRIVYCGENGSGQTVKAANQLMMGLVNAALLESAALPLQAGIPVSTLDTALGGDDGVRALLSDVIGRIQSGSGHRVGVKAGQLEDYAVEASLQGWNLPLTWATADFLRDAEARVMESNRRSPSLYAELMRRRDQ